MEQQAYLDHINVTVQVHISMEAKITDAKTIDLSRCIHTQLGEFLPFSDPTT